MNEELDLTQARAHLEIQGKLLWMKAVGLQAEVSRFLVEMDREFKRLDLIIQRLKQEAAGHAEYLREVSKN